jgi:putative methyltransferase (TIGR04325 family)
MKLFVKQFRALISRLLVLVRVRERPSRSLAFFGNFQTWSEAVEATTGYDSDHILEKCKQALLKVRDGIAVYERDSVLFEKIQYSWPLTASLLRVAQEYNGRLSVLDFGGSLGSSYFQNRKFLSVIADLHWAVVEQENFVKCGREFFQSEQLSFFLTIEECCRANLPNVILASSSLPYIEEPHKMITYWKTLHIPYIIIDRTYFIDASENRITVQTIPPEIYNASYPAWFFNEAAFLSLFSPEYELIADFDSYMDAARYLDDAKATERGMLLRRVD